MSAALTAAIVDQVVKVVEGRLFESTPAERMARQADDLLERFDQAGGGRDAAKLVAIDVARDRYDPSEVERIAQRVRALARRRKAQTQPLRLPDVAPSMVAK